MKKLIFTFRRQVLLLAIMLFCCTWLNAQQVTITVTEMYSEVRDGTFQISSSGGLQAAFDVAGYTDEAIASITDLKIITGPGVHLTMANSRPNGSDAREDVPVGDFALINSMTRLVKLDLSESVVGSQISRSDNSFPRSALINNASIKTIIFPKNLVGFNRSTFANSVLEGTITIPKSVTTVGEYNMTFENCRGISAFAVETGSTSLKATDGILYTANGETLIMYPAGKQDLSFNIPEGVKTLSTSAFGWNDYLEELGFAASLVNLPRQDQIVNGSTKIKKYTVAAGNPILASTNGFLVDKTTGTLMAYPPGNTDETIIIDGSIVKIVPSGYFSYAVANLKNIIFTEGVETIGYTSFKIGNGVVSKLEYVELPSTLKNIEGEAFVGNKNLLQVICKAENPPTLAANQIFRESNGKNVRLGVPATSVSKYKASTWNISVSAGTNAFPEDQIMSYNNITMVDGICMQSASVSGYSVSVKAGEAPAGEAFSGWTSTPATSFANSKASVTSFTMPDSDITVTALFSLKKPYIIENGITPSGTAAIGSDVNIDAAPTKGGQPFYRWEVLEGNGVEIVNPNAVSTSFTMIDGPVKISAIYATAYKINMCGGYAVLEAFPGETVTIKAAHRPGQTFSKWTTLTSGVTIANENSETTTFVMPAKDVTIDADF